LQLQKKSVGKKWKTLPRLSGLIDPRFMAAALALAERGRALSAPNPNVGCVIVKGGRVVGRGWTQTGGRPHAEAMALAQAGSRAKGATAYVTLEPCAHESARGEACSALLIGAGIAHVIIALQDPDPRTHGLGIARLITAGITVDVGIMEQAARASMAGWLMQQKQGRPFITLKLATSLDGCIALANGESHWITGPVARAHTHMVRAKHNGILVGRGTLDVDQPQLTVRLPGLNNRSPQRYVLTRGVASEGWTALANPADVHTLDLQYLMIEGGAQTAAAFLKAGLVDRLMLYRAPIVLGRGHPCLGDVGLSRLADAHNQWARVDHRQLGIDTLDVFDRI
jgi:diaminohydroxyphosphoribosylaminopyrimidine deaminase / 5-amino-6-(5-phosphoribosylamino)uracil reductase